MPVESSPRQAEQQKRQLISRSDYRYWLERRRPRVSYHGAPVPQPEDSRRPKRQAGAPGRTPRFASA